MSPQATALTEAEQACLEIFNSHRHYEEVINSRVCDKRKATSDAYIRMEQATRMAAQVGERLAKGV